MIPQLAPGKLAPGKRVYAVGDVHGCADRLTALHQLIAADLAQRPIAAPQLIHLGDYIDRGPDSAGVIARLADGDPIEGLPTINLMGNHERIMLDALAGEPAAGTDWIINGGAATLRSWSIPPNAAQAVWRERIPEPHLRFVERLAMIHQVDDYLFVHAGLRPGIPLDRQSPEDLLWIRQVFLESHADHGAIVVHGHTPKSDPVVRPNRIGIDTGAVYGGDLTCLVLEADKLRFLRV